MQPHSQFQDQSAMYLIRLLGNLDARWLDYFDGISIVVTSLPGIPYVSTICMHTSDQTLLLGILNTLYNFQYPILSLEAINVPDKVSNMGMTSEDDSHSITFSAASAK